MTTGEVWLVGAGPGDVGLLTKRAAEVLERADCVVYDRLVSPSILTVANPRATYHYVGKQASRHTVPQREIEEILVGQAKAGKTVVRLKGGDPFVFGRGGEELERLHQDGIPVQVIPGITSAVGVSAYAGIPVTHRQLATSFTVVTGHECVSDELTVDWSKLSRPHSTLVILMGVAELPTIVQKLMEAGRSKDVPAAMIQSGSTANQKTVTATLGTLVQKAREEEVQAPAIIVVGEVVGLRDRTKWWDVLPRFGERWLVVQDGEHSANDVAQLQSEGAEVFALPLHKYTKPNALFVEKVARRIDEHASVIVAFQSALGARQFFQGWRASGRSLRELTQLRFAAASDHVNQALNDLFDEADFVGSWMHDSDSRFTSEFYAFLTDIAAREVIVEDARPQPPKILQNVRVSSLSSFLSEPDSEAVTAAERIWKASDFTGMAARTKSILENGLQFFSESYRCELLEHASISLTAKAAFPQGKKVMS